MPGPPFPAIAIAGPIGTASTLSHPLPKVCGANAGLIVGIVPCFRYGCLEPPGSTFSRCPGGAADSGPPGTCTVFTFAPGGGVKLKLDAAGLAKLSEVN